MKSKRFLIIGGGSGIGLASATLLFAAGAKVIIAGRDQKRLQDARKLLGAEVEIVSLDIADEENVVSAFAGLNQLDGIVCTGGHTPPGSINDLTLNEAKRGFDSKFFGQYCVVKYGLKKMRDSGSFVLTSGVFAVRPTENVGVLAAVNGAIESFVRAMAVEIAPMRINALAPGFIDTQRFKQISGKNPEALAKVLKSKVPLQRVGTPVEAAEAVLYLLSNSYVTGTTLYIDGGLAQR